MARLRGNLLVGQSGGPTMVINSTLAGVLQEAALHEEIDEIYGMSAGIQGLLDEEMCDLRRLRSWKAAGERPSPSGLRAGEAGSARRPDGRRADDL